MNPDRVKSELGNFLTSITIENNNVLNIILLDSENYECNEWLNKYYKEESSKKIETKKETIETNKKRASGKMVLLR